jgi:hypothetical protein
MARPVSKIAFLLISRLTIFLIITSVVGVSPSETNGGRGRVERFDRGKRVSGRGGKKPTARMEVNNHKNGTSSLIFKFLNVPATFQVDKILLNVEQLKPASPVQGSPSEQVKAAYYTAGVSDTVFDQNDPTIVADVRLYHNPREPYVLAIVCLWYSRANTHVEFKVKPKYLDSEGKEMSITTSSQEGVVILENRLTVSPTDLRTAPSAGSTEPSCDERNAGQGD